MSTSRRPRLVPLLLGLASITMVACGGGDATRPDAEADVERAASTLLKTKSPTLSCATLITARLVKEIYGSQSKCRSIVASVGDQVDGGGKVTDIAITGRAARVAVMSDAGRQRIGGHVTFVQQAGAWKADRFEDDYLRSILLAEVKGATSGVFTEPTLRRCVSEKVPSLPAGTVRTFVFNAIRKDPDARDGGIDLVLRCPAPLAVVLADQLMKAVTKRGRSAANLRCIEDAMITPLSLKPLAKIALKRTPRRFEQAALAGIVSGADKACRKGAPDA